MKILSKSWLIFNVTYHSYCYPYIVVLWLYLFTHSLELEITVHSNTVTAGQSEMAFKSWMKTGRAEKTGQYQLTETRFRCTTSNKHLMGCEVQRDW